MSFVRWVKDRWFVFLDWYSHQRDTHEYYQEKIRELKFDHKVETDALRSTITLQEQELKFLTLINQKHLTHIEAEIAVDSRRIAVSQTQPIINRT